MRLLVTKGPVHEFPVAGAEQEGADGSWPGEGDGQRRRQGVRGKLV